MSLRFIPGAGRLLKTDAYLAFFAAPSDELLELVSGADEADHAPLFKTLGSTVIQSGFKLPSFVVLTLSDAPWVFAYGDVKLVGGEARMPIKSSSAFTWVERELTDDERTVLTIDRSDGNEPSAEFGDCYLEGGCVPADVFVWHVPQPQNDQVPQPQHQAVPVSDIPDRSHADSFFADAGRTPHIPAPLAPSGFVDTNPEANETMLGGGPPPIPADQPSSTVVEQPLHHDLSAEKTHEAHRDEGLNGDDPYRTSIFGDNGTNGAVKPAPSRSRGELRLDDGQNIEIGQSVYIGRYPSKHGLPPGYDAIVIASDHVSRIHWELVYDGESVSVADLGSTTGTYVQGPGDDQQTRLAAGHLVPIENGTVITFGDRSASFVNQG